MDAGPEFEYSEEELRWLSEMLINEEENVIERTSERSSNRNFGLQLLEELKKENNVSKWALFTCQNYFIQLNSLQKEIQESSLEPLFLKIDSQKKRIRSY